MKKTLILIGSLLAIAVYAATQSQFFSGNVIVAGTIADPAGLAWIKEAPNDGQEYSRKSLGWVVTSAGGGLADAPNNGNTYGRQSAAWVNLGSIYAAGTHTHAAGDITSGTLGTARLGSGTANSSSFLRGDQAWAAVGWTDVTGKPSTFTPSTHAHDTGDITSGILGIVRGGTGGGTAGDARTSLDVPSRGGSGASGTWGISITGDAGTLDGIDSTGFSLSGHTHSGVYEPVFAKGDLVAGSGTSLSGTLTGRLVGSGNVTITSTGTGVTDHGALTGLADDDHTQYHTDARGDARYLRLTGGTVTGSSSFTDGLIVKAPGSGGSINAVAVFSSDPTTSGSAIQSRAFASFKTDLGTMPPSTHSHAISDVTGLQTALDGKSATGHTHPDLANFVFITVSAVTDSNQDATYRSVLGTVKSGYSSTLAADSLSSSSVLKIEASGIWNGDDGHDADVELKVGSSWKVHFDITEPLSTGQDQGVPWSLTAWVTITTAGSSASVNATAWVDYSIGEGNSGGAYGPSTMIRSKGLISGTLNTTVGNAVDLVYRGNDANANSFSCTHFILSQF